MKNDQPESSFQSPKDYKDYGEDSTAAMMAYQRIRRPLMFHLFLFLMVMPKGFILAPFMVGDNQVNPAAIGFWGSMITNSIVFLWFSLWFTPILGIVSCFRKLEDGFQIDDEDQPVFTLKTEWIKPGVAATDSFGPFIDRLKWEWSWRTWMFYPVLLVAPAIGLFVLIKRGIGMFMDIFFLRCWDKWYYAINEKALKEKSDKRFIRGSQILELAKTSGAAPINFIKNKLGKRELEKDLKAKNKLASKDSTPSEESPNREA